MASSANWHSRMSIYGGHYADARRCTACKPPCALFDLLACNRFTHLRIKWGHKVVESRFMKDRRYTQWPQRYRRKETPDAGSTPAPDVPA
jgi:hypothetical protein